MKLCEPDSQQVSDSGGRKIGSRLTRRALRCLFVFAGTRNGLARVRKNNASFDVHWTIAWCTWRLGSIHSSWSTWKRQMNGSSDWFARQQIAPWRLMDCQWKVKHPADCLIGRINGIHLNWKQTQAGRWSRVKTGERRRKMSSSKDQHFIPDSAASAAQKRSNTGQWRDILST